MSNRQRAFTLVEERLYEARCNHRRGSSAQHGAHDSRIQVASALIENAIFHTRHLQTGFGCEHPTTRVAHTHTRVLRTRSLQTTAPSPHALPRHMYTHVHTHTHTHTCVYLNPTVACAVLRRTATAMVAARFLQPLFDQ